MSSRPCVLVKWPRNSPIGPSCTNASSVHTQIGSRVPGSWPSFMKIRHVTRSDRRIGIWKWRGRGQSRGRTRPSAGIPPAYERWLDRWRFGKLEPLDHYYCVHRVMENGDKISYMMRRPAKDQTNGSTHGTTSHGYPKSLAHSRDGIRT